ncbi:MAG: TadE-like protein [Actinobacteria bacterium]|uniref:Unannotated protein n=1 Tax=freshwater metagenome TaxID=449393 RepID=A0A6J6YIS7_9ZZZZ|nr:TadE-like protein [Actinomycetota bacterium]MSW76595.1 TadE-like protein [Actinomycetota bacterium]MSX56325.1 TadE-like protein [Actinomycetota bacterium]MSX92319.1 TadE-like protein [Actinomycetota bacterium]MSZ82042.1 TadE-like protein [Actinomycetota bacterium]
MVRCARPVGDTGDAGEKGQATALLLAVVVLAVLCAVGLAQLGASVVRHERAQAAADAAALAGAAQGRAAAERIAGVNGASLRSFVVLDVGDGTVEVTVELNGSVAVARAARAP